MALTHDDFMIYPLQIVGIDLSVPGEGEGTEDIYIYDEKIQYIEKFVVEDMSYSGEASDVSAILPYFVYWFFLQNETSMSVVNAGENYQVKEFTEPSILKQVKNWNTGVEKLRALFGITNEGLAALSNMSLSEKIHSFVLQSGKTINENYLSKRTLL